LGRYAAGIRLGAIYRPGVICRDIPGRAVTAGSQRAQAPAASSSEARCSGLRGAPRSPAETSGRAAATERLATCLLDDPLRKPRPVAATRR